MKIKFVGSFLCLLALWTPPLAQGLSNLRYYPNPLYTDDTTITLKWISDRTLKRHYLYKVTIQIISEHKYGCDGSGKAYSNHPPSRGHTVKIELTSFHEWCNGRVILTIGYSKEPEVEECFKTTNEFGEEEPAFCPEKEYPFHPIFSGEFRILSKP